MKKAILQTGLVVAALLLALSLPLYTIFWIYPQFTEIITFEKEVDARQVANHIAKMLVLDTATGTLARGNITDNFVLILEKAQADFDLAKLKIFSARGEVLYSTDARDIGGFNTNSYFSDIVAKGKIFSRVVPKNEKSMEGEVLQKDVVETYVPLMSEEHFIGAFEIYYDITYSDHLVSRFVEKSRIIILLLSMFLLLSIMSIALSAVICRKRLDHTEKRMQMLKDQLPPLYTLPRHGKNP